MAFSKSYDLQILSTVLWKGDQHENPSQYNRIIAYVKM